MAQNVEKEQGEAVLTILPSGDGFAYASMSAECLVALTYFKLLEIDTARQSVDIKIIQGWDLNKSPDGQLPFLQCGCGQLFGSNFLILWRHFHTCSSTESRNLDPWMSEEDRADAIAYVLAPNSPRVKLIKRQKLFNGHFRLSNYPRSLPVRNILKLCLHD